MRNIVPVILAPVLVVLVVGTGPAQTTSHSVTIDVQAINEVGIAGGNLTLTINSATAGSEPDNATDAATADLDWTTNESTRKITIQTDLLSPTFTLTVACTNTTGGTGAGTITLSSTAQDFVTGVSQTTGGCDLNYTASATASDGTGTETHTVTFTITAA